MKRLRGKLKEQRDLLIRLSLNEESETDQKLRKANYIDKEDIKDIFDVEDQTIYRAIKNKH